MRKGFHWKIHQFPSMGPIRPFQGFLRRVLGPNYPHGRSCLTSRFKPAEEATSTILAPYLVASERTNPPSARASAAREKISRAWRPAISAQGQVRLLQLRGSNGLVTQLVSDRSCGRRAAAKEANAAPFWFSFGSRSLFKLLSAKKGFSRSLDAQKCFEREHCDRDVIKRNRLGAGR